MAVSSGGTTPPGPPAPGGAARPPSPPGPPDHGGAARPPVPSGPVIHRQTARVLPVDAEGRVLLLHGWDPHRPDHPFWFTVGGAADDGESLRDAAVRELYEETRIRVEPERLGEPIAQNVIEFSWGGHRIAQDQTFYAVAVGSAAVSLEGLDEWERATTDKYGWLSADALTADEHPAHPDIPDLIRAAVASVRNRPE
jgi:8-oxo-dGTP pyrophosphatase MutT (NUDIX family)